MKKDIYVSQMSLLSKKAKAARRYVLRICELLTKESGRKFTAEMNAWNNAYEGHIIDSGKCEEIDPVIGLYQLSFGGGEDIGMIFWGGHYSRKKYKDALSKAWISLLEDCIGNAENGKISDFHSLTNALETYGPKIDFNCKTTENLEELLKSHDC